MTTRSEAIKSFLESKAESDLSKLYNIEMECQVNVGQDGGERVDGEFIGRKWHGWSDGIATWKSFRIPYGSATEPTYEDKKISFDLAQHAEGIGMTGWNWEKRLSLWIAYDFDAILGHSEKHKAKLTNEQLDEVKAAAQAIDWVTVRFSASGKGLHLYVFLEGVSTANHGEHAALARSVLGKMSALVGFDFDSKVDICGGNMWVWHRKSLGTDGLKLIKQGCKLPTSEVPKNWRDHIKVVERKRRKNLPQELESTNVEELAGTHPSVQLDSAHRELITYLKKNNHMWWWDQDQHMLVTHTMAMKKAHVDLKLKGYFETNSDGSNLNEQNCYAFPLRKGAWSIRRYSMGVQEHASWEQDGAGWTRCYYNRECDLPAAARAHGGVEDPSGGFSFRTADKAIDAARLLGTTIHLGPQQLQRECKLKTHKDGRLIVEIKYEPHDRGDEMEAWLNKKGKWIRIYKTNFQTPDEPDVGNHDDLIRHLVTSDSEDYGWMVKSDETWRTEPLAHVRVALGSIGYSDTEVKQVLGSSVFKPWRTVNKPFQPEYPGDREWNRHAAQLKFIPTKETDSLKYPTWMLILDHCGQGLNDEIKHNTWAKANGIVTGGDYLKCWIASLLQEPTEPLPYLFFWAQEQNTGKSIFHEMIDLLLTKGYVRADIAIASGAGFNAELEGAILCVIEETDLEKSKVAYNRIKDWVTSREIMIHKKGQTPFHIQNTTHWVQCANDHTSCPIFTGDTRITMCHVPPLAPTKLIPKKLLLPMLEKEASDFLAELLKLELPPSPDRLNIPVIETMDKEMAQSLNLTTLENFIREKCKLALGREIKFSDFYSRFVDWSEKSGEPTISKIKVGRELPPQYIKGRIHQTAQFHIGNIAWAEDTVDAPTQRFIVKDGFLELVLL